MLRFLDTRRPPTTTTPTARATNNIAPEITQPTMNLVFREVVGGGGGGSVE
jgi:hypothetical protein